MMNVRRTLLSLALAAGTTAVLGAQWDPHPFKNVPRLPNGRIDMNAPAPRTADGKVDLSGFWMPGPGEGLPRVKHLLDLASDLPGRSAAVPFQPWAKAIYDERVDNNGKDHPGVRCWPSGLPEKNNIPDGMKIIQTPDVMLFLYESRTIYRQIFTDGRSHPKNDPQPTWQGYSIGKWEGDTFVVDTIGFNGKTWLDMRGLPSTDALHVIERFTRPRVGEITIDVTIDDPKAYTRPWDVKLTWELIPDTELIESICEENSRDEVHMVGK